MTTSAPPPISPTDGSFRCFVTASLSRSATHVLLGACILAVDWLLDILIGPYLLFPILFVVPVMLSAWFCNARLAYALAVLLPAGRFFIVIGIGSYSSLAFAIANSLIRVAVLVLIAYLVSRTARQTRDLQERVNTYVTICAWSRTVEYKGEWISFEEYLQRRFKVNTSHGVSPAEAERLFGRKPSRDQNS